MARRNYDKFGSGSFVGGYQRHDLANEPMLDQARALGWSDGCPVADELTDPGNTQPGRGPENMVNRYGEVNFWFGQIVREIAEVNPGLAEQMMQDVSRRDDEHVGAYEGQSVPAMYHIKMAPMNTLAGYSLPRLFAVNLKAGGDDKGVMQDRMTESLDIIASVSRGVEDPLALLASVAGEFSNRGLLPDETILSNILSNGWLSEHGAISTVAEFKACLKATAPELYNTYVQMSASEKSSYKLA